MVRYKTSVVTNADGQELHLPGSDVFTMPHALLDSIDVRVVSTIQEYPIGTRLVDGDNVYRYAEYGGTTKAGDLCQSEAPDAAHDLMDPGNHAIGATSITLVESITLVLNEYAGGKFITEGGAGGGFTYDIISNTAVSAAAGGIIVLKQGLTVAITTATNVRLMKSRWKEIIICPTSLTGTVAGVGLGVGADGSFGWVCTKGPVGAMQDLTAGASFGVGLIPGATAGELALYDVSATADIQPVATQIMTATGDTLLGTVLMQLE